MVQEEVELRPLEAELFQPTKQRRLQGKKGKTLLLLSFRVNRDPEGILGLDEELMKVIMVRCFAAEERMIF